MPHQPWWAHGTLSPTHREVGMKRPSLWAEDTWRERPWPKDLSSQRQNRTRAAWAVGDIRVWLVLLAVYFTWATWDLVSGHFMTAALPSALVIEAAAFTWLRRDEVPAIWHRR